jgi:predicted nucleic acid-binding protein
VTLWLLDTNVLSELRRPRPERKVVTFISGRPLESLHVSSVTLAEIRYGIELVEDVARRASLRNWLDNDLRPFFAQRVLELSEDVIYRWRLLVEQGRKVGHTFSQPDLFIAATALHHGLTVVTRNTDDYAKSGTPTFNPWIDTVSEK